MSQSRTDELFARFCATGDPRALARVFDDTAGELVRVAAYLCGDVGCAEDLVQSTFLKAIESRADFEAGRPVLPWLLGILGNQVRSWRRERKQNAARPTIRERVVGDPADAAAGRELHERCEHALQGLDSPYRQVLELHLVHGLTAKEITRVLDRPGGTVRTQMVRGLELLRRALPAGFVAGAAITVCTPAQLAAMRRTVLRRASLGTAGIGMLGGALIMSNKTTAVLAVAIACLVCGTFLWQPWVESTPAAPSSPVEPARADPGIGATGDWSAKASGRVPIVDSRSADTAPTPGDVAFTGRCLDETGGVPLPGCQIHLWAAGRPESSSTFESIDGELVGDATTDADGAFWLRAPHESDGWCLVTLEREDRLGRRRWFGPLDPGQLVDLGNLRLRRGARVTGRVVDLLGQAVPKITFRLTRTAQERFDPLPEHRFVQVATDAAGRFACPEPLASGRWNVWWMNPGLPDGRYLTTVDVPEASTHVLELVLQVEDARQTIRGTATDAAGEPVASLWIEGTGGGTFGQTRTDEHGRFAMFRIGPYDEATRGPVALTLPDPGCGFDLPSPTTGAWGESEVQLLVRSQGQIEVEVVDARTGALLPRCDVRCARVVVENGEGSLLPYPCNPQVLPSGAIALRAVPAGANVLHVTAIDDALAPSTLVRFDAVADDTLRVELQPRVALLVKLVDGTGAAVGGSEVRLFQQLRPEPEPALLLDRRRLDRPPSRRWWNGGTTHQPLDTGTTDPEGEVTLQAPSADKLTVVAYGPGHTPRVVADVVASADMAPLQVVVERGATLRGRITPAAVLDRFGTTPAMERIRPIADEDDRAFLDRRRSRIVVMRTEAEQDLAHWQNPIEVPIEAGGTFYRRGFPAGTYELVLQAVLPIGMTDGQNVHTKLGQVSLRDGEETQVERDLGNLQPGRLRGRVLVNDEPWAFREGRLDTKLGDGFAAVSANTDASGRFESPILPGRYSLHMFYKTPGGNVGYWFAPEQVEVLPEQEVDFTFHVRRVVAKLRLLTAEGAPAPGVTLVMDTEKQPRGWTTWTTDEDGWIRIDPAPIEPFALIALTDVAAKGLTARLPGSPRDALLGPLRVPDHGTEARFEVRLPESWHR